MASELKLRQCFEFFYPALNRALINFGGASQAESFAAKRSHHTPMDHCAPDVLVHRTMAGRKVSHHPAHKRITRASRVHHPMQRIGWAKKESFRTRQNRAV